MSSTSLVEKKGSVELGLDVDGDGGLIWLSSRIGFLVPRFRPDRAVEKAVATAVAPYRASRSSVGAHRGAFGRSHDPAARGRRIGHAALLDLDGDGRLEVVFAETRLAAAASPSSSRRWFAVAVGYSIAGVTHRRWVGCMTPTDRARWGAGTGSYPERGRQLASWRIDPAAPRIDSHANRHPRQRFAEPGSPHRPRG
jgi:hypothetical protein